MNDINLAIDNEEWKEINFQTNFQNIVNFITNNNENDLKKLQSIDILADFEKFDNFKGELIESNMTISNEKYKIIFSILNIIKFLFESEKLILLTDSTFSAIISQKVNLTL